MITIWRTVSAIPRRGPRGIRPGLCLAQPDSHMQTLPKPIRLFFSCADCSGTPVNVSVTATRDGEIRPWIWHAVFPGTGEPPAEMLGSSSHFGEIEADICAKVSRLRSLTGVLAKAD